MIKLLTPDDVAITALLHMEGMPNDFLPSFGPPFLSLLTKTLINDSETISLGYFKNKQLIGVLIASIDTRKTFRKMFINHLFDFLPFILKKCLTNPRYFRYIWQTIFYNNTHKSSIRTEILVLSISKHHQHQGIGTQLIQKLNKELKIRKINTYKVATKSSNKPANLFYQKNGGIFIAQMDIYDRTWNVYRYVLA